MKNKIIFIILALICLIGSMSVASAGAETKLTNDIRLMQNPLIYNNAIVWWDTSANGAYLYNLATGKQISLGSADGRVTTNGNKVVWRDMDGNIDIYDIPSGKKTVAVITGDNYDPYICGNNVVYSNLNADYNSNYVVENIYLYNINTHKITPITSATNGITYGYPSMYGNKVVYLKTSGSYNSGIIYIYDIFTNQTSSISTNGTPSDPDIYGNIVVWSENGNIYMRDISSHKTTQITHNGISVNPSVYGNRVVWATSYNVADLVYGDIYMYDILTTKITRITNTACAAEPDIYGNKIVYLDSRAYGSMSWEASDVYLYDLTSKPTKPIATFTANQTYGTHPLTVIFTYTGTGGTPNSYHWDFGDKTTSNHALTATHTYTKAGTYAVSLKVGNSAGSNTITEKKYINVK
jgi:beta propeller repeat protein